ncbi:MAG: RNA polymerase sigma factor FliA [Nevskiaceae bacterium]|nr:MAG: RNA polymerase sigma factor FliA [Nevskiaceae bacterium]TBR72182.1 MAG: RNA polymerase sigma factor FliA [Nevskiaceae bacterium]
MSIVDAYLEVGRQSPETLVRQNRELVRRIAYHLLARLPSNVDIDDLIQSGTIGLLEAARNFDPKGGASFETFAGIRIRGAMLDELRRGDWVPRSTHRRSREMAKAIHKVEGRTGRAAEMSEIAAEMGVSADEYAQIAADASRGPWLSFEEMPEGWSENVSADTSSPAEEVEKSGFSRALAQAIEELPEREKLALSLYYEQDLNLKEIGAVLGVSESRVCQLHGQAQARLRARLKDWIN